MPASEAILVRREVQLADTALAIGAGQPIARSTEMRARCLDPEREVYGARAGLVMQVEHEPWFCPEHLVANLKDLLITSAPCEHAGETSDQEVRKITDPKG
jgi:hypothetical protein